MFKTIAVAVDGSDASLAAVRYGCQVVHDDGQLVLIMVKDAGARYQWLMLQPYSTVVLDDLAEDMEQWVTTVHDQAMAIVESCVNVRASWLAVTLQAGRGGPANLFLSTAIGAGAELLIVGRHHGSAGLENLLGSFPSRLMTHGTLPVITVPAAAP